ncbi:MAG: ABC transporter permease [Eubacteriales bacterium]|nr:ABC transporter permease [Eubacteriales bacterium]MDD3882433.1 ABC transporter permease [Eubacteriales bacterium]MDD4513155.1 ABC transporter permease [Eubacteriales bacterium]
MNALGALTLRNIRLFFKDKGTLVTSMITPIILLVLYVTFLSNVYKSSLLSSMPNGLTLPDGIVGSFVGGQLISSLLAVSCVSVSFCANLISVQDKYLGARNDLSISPVKPSCVALSYYLATLFNALLVCFLAGGACMLYASVTGFYMSADDILHLILDIVMLVMFGTALSSLVCSFLSTEGQLSAVGTIISAGYGFICGAYMPISQFGEGLQKALSFLPGTYGTSLMRNHAMGASLREMAAMGIPSEFIEEIKNAFDCNVYFMGNRVAIPTMYLILGGSILLIMIIYLLSSMLRSRKRAA